MSHATIDLNLLKVMDALLQTESVSRAAAQLHVTQPAISHALKRLREIFDDPILIRHAGRMQATDRAHQLKPHLERAMSDCFSLVSSGRSFDPQSSGRVFRLAMSDAVALEALPRVIREVRSAAPNINLVIETGGPSRSCDLLLNEKADLAVGVFPAIPACLNSAELYRDTLVCIADKSNKLLKRGRLSLQDFLNSPHVTVASGTDSGIQLDQILDAMSLKRRIVASVPHYLAIPGLIEGTDLVAHSRMRLLNALKSSGKLVTMPVPVSFDIPDLVFSQVWHIRNELDNGHAWLRATISKAFVGK